MGAVLLGRMKLEDASKTDELKATQAELTAEQDKLEATLAKLNALESKKLAMQVSSTTRGKGRLQRMSTTLHMDDPAANDAIKRPWPTWARRQAAETPSRGS